MVNEMIPRWIQTAQWYVGQKEIKGPVNNGLITKMFQRIRFGATSDETPWCAAFVGNCLEENGIVSTRSAWALSYKDYGQDCKVPTFGAIAVMPRYNSAHKLVGGHVTFVVGRDDKGRIMGLGGNQGDKVSIAPFDPSRIIAYRYPDGFLLPSREALPVYAGTGKTSSNEA